MASLWNTTARAITTRPWGSSTLSLLLIQMITLPTSTAARRSSAWAKKTRPARCIAKASMPPPAPAIHTPALKCKARSVSSADERPRSLLVAPTLRRKAGLRIQRRDISQVPVQLVVVEPEADHKAVGDL